MNRQTRRRIRREWDKIKLGSVCTRFLERNGLFTIPHVIMFQAVKVGEDLICVYNVGMFQFRDDFGFLANLIFCELGVDSLFRSLGNPLALGFVSEEELETGEEIEAYCRQKRVC